jgi:hypothetical protein
VLAMTRSRLPALASMRSCRFTISSDRRTPSRKLAPLTGGAEGVDDRPAGVVAGVGAADPVGHRPQADLAEIEHRVFVDGSHEPDIRSGAGVEAEAGVGAGGQAWPLVPDRVFHADAPPTATRLPGI